MSKYPKLLEPICCEWELHSGHICGEAFDDVDLFTAHVRGHLSVGEEACCWRSCDFSSPNPRELIIHVLFHPYHTYQKLLGRELGDRLDLPSCRMDEESVNRLPLVKVDLECLWGLKEGRQCGRCFDSIGEFYSHVHAHAMTETNICCRWKECTFTSRERYKVLQHTKIHTNEKVIACPTCGALFANNTKLKDHLNRQVEPTDPKLSCTFCQKCFPSNRLLREHIRVHVNTLKCPHCDLTCNSPSRLLHHIRFRHMDSKPHQCPLCHKSFKTQHTLTVHIESHRQANYMCMVAGCGHVAKTQKSWQMHMKRCHMSEQLLYCCHVCSLRFAGGNALTGHLKKAHGFELPPGHCRFRYVSGEDGLRRLQTVRLDDHNVLTPELSAFAGPSPGAESPEGSGEEGEGEEPPVDTTTTT